MLSQILDMADLEAGVLRLCDDLAGAGQLTVGEHVAVGEGVGLDPAAVVRLGDAVVEQPAARAQLA